MPHPIQPPPGVQPSGADIDAHARAVLFGTAGAQGYLPQALTLSAGQPTAGELEEAEELLLLAALEFRRWRRNVTREAADRVRAVGMLPLFNSAGDCVPIVPSQNPGVVA